MARRASIGSIPPVLVFAGGRVALSVAGLIAVVATQYDGWENTALVIGGLVLVNVVLFAVGAGQHSARGAGKRTRVALVFDVGGLGDQSFNDVAYNGLSRAENELDIEALYIEPGDGSDRESAIRERVRDGYDLVIGVGFIFTDDLRKAAARYPDTKFACIDMSISPGDPPVPKNLVGLRFREHEGSFLVGALAALVSRTGKVGFVGGMQIPLIKKFEIGYTAGVKHVCPQCDVLVGYAGSEPKAFADPAKGTEMARAQFMQGADIIFHASGKTGEGVFNAAEERGKLAIGVDADQYHLAPGHVLSSMRKGVDVAVFDTIQAVAQGRFEGGVIREFGLAEDGVGYVWDDHNRPLIPETVHERIEGLREDIIAGRIEVPFE